MKLIAITDSNLSDQILSKYFSLSELKNISKDNSTEHNTNNLLGRIALKHSYGTENFDQIIINYNNYGKPLLRNAPKLYCSIAHSYGLAVAASSDIKIGVDIEKIRSHDESLLHFIANEDEIALFSEKNKDVLVTKIWIMKESVSKAIGLGLAYSFEKMCIKTNVNGYNIEAGGINWNVEIVPFNDYLIAYCYPSDQKIQIELEVKHTL